MSEDSFTEVTTESWFGRLGKTFFGVLLGLLLLVAGVVLLFWNEGRAVTRAKSLAEGLGIVISVDAGQRVPSNDGRLVHLVGRTQPEGTLQDKQFGLNITAVKLKRSVEMYQWEEESESETRKKLGGGTETVTTYSYRKTWSGTLQNSSSFKKPEGHENPLSLPYKSKTLVASKVTLGAFTLASDLISELDDFQALPLESLPEALEPVALLDNGTAYLKATEDSSPQTPQIGDTRVSFSSVRPQQVSVVARQDNTLLGPYSTSVGDEIALLQTGTRTAEQMFAKARTDNTIFTWILRGVGLLMLLVGFALVFKPLSVVLDVVPLFGNIAEMGIMLVSAILALVCGCIVIAVAWLFYRPLLGGSLLVLAVGGILMLIKMRKRTDSPAAPAAPPPPPPAP